MSSVLSDFDKLGARSIRYRLLTQGKHGQPRQLCSCWYAHTLNRDQTLRLETHCAHPGIWFKLFIAIEL